MLETSSRTINRYAPCNILQRVNFDDLLSISIVTAKAGTSTRVVDHSNASPVKTITSIGYGNVIPFTVAEYCVSSAVYL